MVEMTKIVAVTRSISTGRSGDPYEPIIADFRAAMSQLKCASSQRLLRLGISMAQVHLLNSVQRRGEMTMSQLAEMLDISLSNATGLVDRIEERGFLERVRVPEDRRVVLIRITPAGSRMLEEADALSDEILRNVLGRLRPGQLTGVAQAVADLRAALDAPAAAPTDRHAVSITAPRSGASLRTATRTAGTDPAAASLAATQRKD
jgi:DNA-binding MarR family transcriptional regulator